LALGLGGDVGRRLDPDSRDVALEEPAEKYA